MLARSNVDTRNKVSAPSVSEAVIIGMLTKNNPQLTGGSLQISI